MRYRNSEMKIDQLVSYLNEEKINLSPAFQRGHVWQLKTRRKLVGNIVLGRPIPAIFLYKEAEGSKYTYNILDGKQRLESLILFIADARNDVKIPNWSRYFFGPMREKAAKFTIDMPSGKKTAFDKLSDEVVRDFREYSIPTVEISLVDETSLDEVITLFVDINQQGEPVNRFDIVKAMFKDDPLMKCVFDLLAVEEKRGQDVFYKPKKTDFTRVLKQLQVVENVGARNAQVDKMWEKLLEIALFARTSAHRKPVAVLKEFIAPNRQRQPKLNFNESNRLRAVFGFLRGLSKTLEGSRLFSDQTHSYTVITSMLRVSLLETITSSELSRKLKLFSRLIDGERVEISRSTSQAVRKYLELSEKQTTDVSRRENRDTLFVEIVTAL